MDNNNANNIVGHISHRKEVSIVKGLHNCFGFNILFLEESGLASVTKLVPGFPAEKVLSTRDVITHIEGIDLCKFKNNLKKFSKFIHKCKMLDILFLSIVRTEEVVTIIDDEEEELRFVES